ncbi:Nad(+) Hydrolase Sarm1 [Manis pentadactyla]|nr:Nad(+) Hydrolase Sarm1 [Manis pentadactyla]
MVPCGHTSLPQEISLQNPGRLGHSDGSLSVGPRFSSVKYCKHTAKGAFSEQCRAPFLQPCSPQHVLPCFQGHPSKCRSDRVTVFFKASHGSFCTRKHIAQHLASLITIQLHLHHLSVPNSPS